MSFTFRKITGFSALLVILLISSQCYAADLTENLKKLHLPDGFGIEIFSDNVPGARSMALDLASGYLFVTTRGDRVYAVKYQQQDQKAGKVTTILDDQHVANGIALHDGMLYIAEQNRITRYPLQGFTPEEPFADKGEVIYDKLPDKSWHGWRYLEFSPEGKLYVTVGVPCNICDTDAPFGSILRMNPDGSDAEVFAHGIRNSVGMAFQPGTGTLFFTDNNTDMMGDDIPPGELNAAPKAGMFFGFPYYAGGHVQHPDWKGKTPPQEVTFPVVEFDAHSAPLGVEFYTGKLFPEKYRNDAFVVNHGSWNRSVPIGYRLMHVMFDQDGKVTGHEIFIDGWLQNNRAWGRPVDILQLPDGSLLVSDDQAGVIYRVYYKK